MQTLRELKLFYYIYCDALLGVRSTSGALLVMQKKASKHYLEICKRLRNYQTPRLDYQTDPRWTSADNRRKGVKDADHV